MVLDFILIFSLFLHQTTKSNVMNVDLQNNGLTLTFFVFFSDGIDSPHK